MISESQSMQQEIKEANERVQAECDALQARVQWFERSDARQLITRADQNFIQKEVVRVRQALEGTRTMAQQAVQQGSKGVKLQATLRSLQKLESVDLPRLRRAVGELEAFKASTEKLIRE